MDNKELDNLEALAKAATKGPWIFTKYGNVMDGEKIFEIVPSDTMCEDRMYIAAANPAAILELIALARASSAAPAAPTAELIEIGNRLANTVEVVAPAILNAGTTECLKRLVGEWREALAAPAAAEGPSLPEGLADVIGAKCAEVKALVGDPWGYRPTDAQRYARLRILGAAPGGSKQLAGGTVLCFQNLDDFVDADIAAHPSRGEFKGDVPLDVVAGEVDAKDAARWQWLREKHDGGDEDWFVYGASSQHLDASVDAAIAAQPKDTTDTRRDA